LESPLHQVYTIWNGSVAAVRIYSDSFSYFFAYIPCLSPLETPCRFPRGGSLTRTNSLLRPSAAQPSSGNAILHVPSGPRQILDQPKNCATYYQRWNEWRGRETKISLATPSFVACRRATLL
ncbi:hypothetical protein K443DRAFT_112233, partial [Laccaria amethystina LaAM-08-1]